MDFYRHIFASRIGPGGIKCACCGPAPGKAKRAYRRNCRRKARAMERQEITQQLAELAFEEQLR